LDNNIAFYRKEEQGQLLPKESTQSFGNFIAFKKIDHQLVDVFVYLIFKFIESSAFSCFTLRLSGKNPTFFLVL